ncbi:oxidoreductase, 2-nitropropane dioxygenase family protein [Mycolicibacterium mageritense DSM 44476 = CIP 104973]|uniref:Nitronate monooxygenase n=1 Tax=Mycolicibacterium mageritense TaxID=53462 RepID=A0ABM7HZ99_MYCME|nr:nitronate monooxygenase [Mycolicibacterium mageritense]MCC9186971.1 nitronate monooxygenase [Mycolicibacterium mageritense]BBX35936.1 hypothetical protein MMAGJ_52180 [Mycolicibacterium mageritense]CDO19561.1 oxidoreductase, 2-nitropropane dioxygenase family protein [Mycolicibacterium mageritense DSM 44476 = CIP 104973]
MDVLDRFKIDVPVVQAGIGSMAPPELASAVAKAGGLGTIGFRPDSELRSAIDHVRQEAPGRAIAVNLLMELARPSHVEVCLKEGIDIVVLAFGGDRALVERFQTRNVTVLAMIGTEDEARKAIAWGVDALIAQGNESGGHLSGHQAAANLLQRTLLIAHDTPVLQAGGIAEHADTRAALDAGAAAVVAGTRFLLTHESPAHPAYQQRILEAKQTVETTLFGLGWPRAHRVVENNATRRWCQPDGTAKALPRTINAYSAPLAKLAPEDDNPARLLSKQRPGLPFFTPAAPIKGMPTEWIERSALYAGDSGIRMTEVISAAQAVKQLAGVT